MRATSATNPAPLNWRPWSMSTISGVLRRAAASPSASSEKSAPIVIDTRCASTRRLCQSRIAAKYTQWLAMGM
jgi:hypothetical protein